MVFLSFLRSLYFKVFGMKFSLSDHEDQSWDLSMDDIFTVIVDQYFIVVIFNDKTHRIFPNTAKNRNNLPAVKLSQESKIKF